MQNDATTEPNKQWRDGQWRDGAWRDDATFCSAVKIVLRHEAGYQRDPRDAGNWTGRRAGAGVLKGTKYGISAGSYPALDIEHLTEDDASAIYYRDWWLHYGYGELPAPLATKVFHLAIMAPEEAHRALQRALRATGYGGFIAENGELSEATRAAARHVDVASALAAFRSEYAGYCRLVGAHYAARTGRPDPYLEGWLNRAYAVL